MADVIKKARNKMKKSNSSSVVLELIALLERFFRVCTQNKGDEEIGNMISFMLEESVMRGEEVMRFSFPNNIRRGLLMEEYYEVDITSDILSMELRNVLVQHLTLTRLTLEHKIERLVCLNAHSYESDCLNELSDKAKRVILKSGNGFLLEKVKISLINGRLNLRVKLFDGVPRVFQNCKTDEALLDFLKRSL